MISDMLNWIDKWFSSVCNDNWEHGHGIKIETIDNPGWEITIDLNGSNFFLNSKNWELFGDFDERWLGYKIENNVFNGAGSSLNLIIYVFKNLIERGYIEDEAIRNNLKN